MSLQPSTSSIMDKRGIEATPEEKDANKIESMEVQPTQEPTMADRKRSQKKSKAESSVDGDETNDVVEVWPENSKRVKVYHDVSSSPKGVRSPSPPPVSEPSAGSNGSWSSLARYIVRYPIKRFRDQSMVDAACWNAADGKCESSAGGRPSDGKNCRFP